MSSRVATLQSSAIREILRVVNRPDVISLAGGLPGEDLFPVAVLGRIAAELFASEEAPRALQYAETEGHAGLRERIAARLPPGVPFRSPDELLVTQGSQQGLDLIAKLVLDPGDEVLVETPAYLGGLQTFRFFGARVTFLPCDREGALPDALAAALRRSPKLVYLTPTFQNPSGVCWSARRRAEVCEVLAGSEPLVIEDDPYRALWYDAEPPAPLCAALDPGRSVYLGSFSKTAVPGLRVAFLAGAAPLVRSCVLAKQATDLHTNTLGQHLLFRFLGGPELDAHVAGLRAEYRRRRDALEAALRAEVGDRLRWDRPAGGMFLWARLAGGGDAARLLERALAEGLAFVPGGEFHAPGGGRDTLRLNFTHAGEARLAEGAARLARALARLGTS
jgi:DNA-binding transcriptional MocR family regulator